MLKNKCLYFLAYIKSVVYYCVVRHALQHFLYQNQINFMTIEVGDTVQTVNKPARLFGALRVLSIEGEYALCSYYLLDKDPQGDERPNELITTESKFPLKDLTVLSKGEK